jgi:hypothetical protein
VRDRRGSYSPNLLKKERKYLERERERRRRRRRR